MALPQNLTICFSKRALRDIERNIAQPQPEQGGALLGPIGQPLISHLIPDPAARTTGASYFPSDQLTSKVQEMERHHNLEFKGIIHSHPGSLDRLSGPDEEALAEGLRINPHMDYFIAPIVTRKGFFSGALGEHELDLGQTKLSCYMGYNRGSRIEISPVPVQTVRAAMPDRPEPTTTLAPSAPASHSPSFAFSRFEQHLKQAVKHLNLMEDPRFFPLVQDGVDLRGSTVQVEGGLELLFMAGGGYPVAAPVLLATLEDGNTEQLQMPWSLEVPAAERLTRAMKDLLSGSGPYRKGYGVILGKSALTDNPERAAIAGWSGRFVAEDPAVIQAQVREGLFARSQGLLSQHIRQKRVLIAGAGSVGSYMAEQLVRQGVEQITLIDPDGVELANLNRSSYDLADVGRTKVDALACRLLNINPGVEITRSPLDLFDHDPETLASWIEAADLVIGTTDQPKAQQALNRYAHGLGTTALYVGLYDGAQGGEVLLVIPEKTPCYACAAATRQGFQEVSSSVDYGTGRVSGEMALVADIHHVASGAVKLALALLLPPEAEANLKAFVEPLLESGQTFLTFSMVPNYWFYPQLLGQVPGQFAYQSVCLTPEKSDTCPVCGAPEHRIDPRSIPLKAPAVTDLRAVLAEAS